jgi:hypothetical protein
VSGDWASAPNPQRWLRAWSLTLTDAGANGGTVDLIFDLGEGGMGVPGFSEPLSNYRLLGRSSSGSSFTDLGLTPTARSGDRLTFSSVDVTQLPDEITLGTLDAGSSPTAVTMAHVVGTPNGWVVMVLTTLLVGGAALTVVVMGGGAGEKRESE